MIQLVTIELVTGNTPSLNISSDTKLTPSPEASTGNDVIGRKMVLEASKQDVHYKFCLTKVNEVFLFLSLNC